MNDGTSCMPLPPVIPRTPANATLSGIITTGAGPLQNWPFILRRDGRPVDKGSLGGSSPNRFENGYWWSGAKGEYQFSGVPEGYYSMEVMVAKAKLTGKRPKLPKADSGLRAPRIGYDPDRDAEHNYEAYSEEEDES